MVNMQLLLPAVALAGVYALKAGGGEDGILARMLAHRRAISAAAGVSVAYVFVDILPELAAKNQALREAAGGAVFAEQRIYLLAPVYWLHLGGFAAYSALIGYLLLERVERGPLALAFYTLAV